MITARTLQDFAGTWTFERSVRHANGDRARAHGSAVLSPAGKMLIYVETGQMSLNDSAPMTTTRRYIWREGLEVQFEDGRAFHTIPAMGGTAEHWCDPDQYSVHYNFAKWPEWSAIWSVKGPRKAYAMTTQYAPTSAD